MEQGGPTLRNASQTLEGGILYFIAPRRSALSGLSIILEAIRMIHGKVSALKLSQHS